MTATYFITVSKIESIIYTFRTLAEAIKFAQKADGTIRNEFGTILQRGSWDK